MGDEAVLQFPTSENRDYVIEYSTDLRNWSPLPGGEVVGTGSVIEIHDGTAGSDPRRFYRVRVLW